MQSKRASKREWVSERVKKEEETRRGIIKDWEIECLKVYLTHLKWNEFQKAEKRVKRIKWMREWVSERERWKKYFQVQTFTVFSVLKIMSEWDT
jgi:hypothetical protein